MKLYRQRSRASVLHYVKKYPKGQKSWGAYGCGNTYSPFPDSLTGELISIEASPKDIEELPICKGCKTWANCQGYWDISDAVGAHGPLASRASLAVSSAVERGDLVEVPPLDRDTAKAAAEVLNQWIDAVVSMRGYNLVAPEFFDAVVRAAAAIGGSTHRKKRKLVLVD